MTRSLDAGRELDETIARLVWGWPANPAPRSGRLHEFRDGWVPTCSLDRESAFLLLDTLHQRGWDWAISTAREREDEVWYYAGLWHRVDPQEYQSAPTLPLAICCAVLAALGEKDA